MHLTQVSTSRTISASDVPFILRRMEVRAMETKGLPELENKPKEHRGLDYLLVAFALFVEVLALILGIYSLAFGAAVMAWFSLREFTKKRRTGKSGRWNVVFGCAGAVVILVLVVVPVAVVKNYMDKHRAVASDVPHEAAQQPQPQASAQTQQAPQSPPSKPSADTTKSHKTKNTLPKPRTSETDNSVHLDNGSKVEQQSSGDCSPNIIGGSPTVNCGPPPPPPLSLNFSQEQMPSSDKNFPFVTKVRVVPNQEWKPVSLAIICDGPVGKIDISMEVSGSYTMQEVASSIAENPNIGLVEIGSPSARPDRPVIALVFSAGSLRVLGVRPVHITNPVFAK
jgi:hypothetical protein